MEMKHANAEMIKAVADNTDLVIFFKESDDARWFKTNINSLVNACSTTEYFLCLPKHKEACLHCLNGGVSQYLSNGMKEWINFGSSNYWCSTHLFMTNECEIHIKPKKEKRWIAVLSNGRVSGWHDEGLEMLKQQYNECAGWQFIEIEVEV